MTLRKMTSLTALLSFVGMVVTSLVLYIVPHGRVAYWADWTLLGLDKTRWGDLHINLGLLFLLALGLHIYYNWKAIVAYLKNKARQVRIFTPDFNTRPLVLTLAILVGHPAGGAAFQLAASAQCPSQGCYGGQVWRAALRPCRIVPPCASWPAEPIWISRRPSRP